MRAKHLICGILCGGEWDDTAGWHVEAEGHSVRVRLTLVVCLLAVAMVASALVTLYLGSRGAEAEANRRPEPGG
jgi:hypothetical protein